MLYRGGLGSPLNSRSPLLVISAPSRPKQGGEGRLAGWRRDFKGTSAKEEAGIWLRSLDSCEHKVEDKIGEQEGERCLAAHADAARFPRARAGGPGSLRFRRQKFLRSPNSIAVCGRAGRTRREAKGCKATETKKNAATMAAAVSRCSCHPSASSPLSAADRARPRSAAPASSADAARRSTRSSVATRRKYLRARR